MPWTSKELNKKKKGYEKEARRIFIDSESAGLGSSNQFDKKQRAAAETLFNKLKKEFVEFPFPPRVFETCEQLQNFIDVVFQYAPNLTIAVSSPSASAVSVAKASKAKKRVEEPTASSSSGSALTQITPSQHKLDFFAAKTPLLEKESKASLSASTSPKY